MVSSQFGPFPGRPKPTRPITKSAHTKSAHDFTNSAHDFSNYANHISIWLIKFTSFLIKFPKTTVHGTGQTYSKTKANNLIYNTYHIFIRSNDLYNTIQTALLTPYRDTK